MSRSDRAATRRPWRLQAGPAGSLPAAMALVAAAVVAASLLGASAASLLGASAASAASSSKVVLAPVPVGATASGVPSFYRPPDPLPAGAPGTLIRAERVTGVPGVPAGATTWRVLYRSRSIYGADIAVSGYVIVPPGQAPKGGFPVISWAHGTTGFNDICAPSLFNNLDGQGGPYLTPDLTAYVSAGFEIAATDYQGLGTPGPHPYLLGDSEGRGVLDAARAARYLPGSHASHTVLVYGHSQGGQAALFAGELARSYAPALQVLGVVAAAPATNLSLIVGQATSATYGQAILEFSLPATLTWSETYRDLPLSDFFTAAGGRLVKTLVGTGCLPQLSAAIRADHVTPSDVFTPGIGTDPVVKAHAKLNDPGRAMTPAPLLVVQGTADTTVPPALTDLYVQDMACPIGDTIDYLHVTGATHGTVNTKAEPAILAWMLARLAGTSAPSTCGTPGDVASYPLS
ncbi:MAG TPA: lipase family protein [Acidimicrobiales bacterium]|nr:lipase family protein [Acidimicrobiales bacterium]